ncbi:hypothetical protein ABEB36_015626 [Hypothenemus hampei]|uniref:CCHC-type domain-containing protein n=1 Tax=Hypothenemus hampei TaxID=57062 RepID=A0ABD1DZA9_HYPHA
MDMMSSKNLECPREGPANGGEYLTPVATAGVCSEGYGGSSKTSFMVNMGNRKKNLERLIDPFGKSDNIERSPMIQVQGQTSSMESRRKTMETPRRTLTCHPREIASADDNVQDKGECEDPFVSEYMAPITPDEERSQDTFGIIPLSIDGIEEIVDDKGTSDSDLSFWRSLMGKMRKEEGSSTEKSTTKRYRRESTEGSDEEESIGETLKSLVARTCSQANRLDQEIRLAYKPKKELTFIARNLMDISKQLKSKKIYSYINELGKKKEAREGSRQRVYQEKSRLSGTTQSESEWGSMQTSCFLPSSSESSFAALKSKRQRGGSYDSKKKESMKDAFSHTLSEGKVIYYIDNVHSYEDSKFYLNKEWEEQGIPKLCKERFPELEQIQEDFAIMEQRCTIKLDTSNRSIQNRLILARYDGSDRDLYEKAVKIRQEKTFEMVFHEDKTNVAIYGYKSTQRKGETTKRFKDTYAITVEGEGQTYSQVLKEVKKAVSPENAKHIEDIRSTRNNKMLITIKKDKQIVEKLEKEIKQALETLHIRGMDALCTKEEIETALKDSLSGERITKKLSDRLLNLQNIRVGCAVCRVEKKHLIVKCKRCWKSGHIERECQGTDMREKCFKCGEEGHKVKECKSIERCPLCQEDGHRASSGRCRDFKSCLAKVRKEEYEKRKDGVVVSTRNQSDV